MTTLQLSIYAMAMGLCLFTGLLTWRSTFHNRAFFIFLTVLSFMLGCDWLMAHPATPLKSLWLIGLMASSFFVAPSALWLAKSAGLTTLTLNVRRHMTIAIIGWLLLIPLATAIHWGTEFAKPGNPTPTMYALFIHTTMLLSVALFILQTVSALQTAFAFLQARSLQNTALFSAIDDPGLNTLRLLIVMLMTNAAIALSRVLYCALLDGVYITLSLAITLGQLAMVVFLALSFIKQHVINQHAHNEALRQQLFQPEQESPSNTEHTEEPTPLTAPQQSAGKYCKSPLPKERQQRIMQRIQEAFDTSQLFTQPGLGLNELCEHIGESAHHVSQAISESEHRNFYDMINQRRIALAAQLLSSQTNTTILEIGFSCGFNSKSTFNSLFKKYQGQTPSQYRKHARATAVPISYPT